jgi:predicted nucleic acid-binding protein
MTPQRRASWIAPSCELDDDLYAKGTVVSNEELAAVDTVRADFRDDWNLHRQTVQSLKQSVDACRNYPFPVDAIIVATANHTGCGGGAL